MGYRGNYIKIDLTGEKFGKLQVLKEVKPKHFSKGKGMRRWLLKCDVKKPIVQIIINMEPEE